MNEVVKECRFCKKQIKSRKLVFCSPECRTLHSNQSINNNWVEGKVCPQKRKPSVTYPRLRLKTGFDQNID